MDEQVVPSLRVPHFSAEGLPLSTGRSAYKSEPDTNPISSRNSDNCAKDLTGTTIDVNRKGVKFAAPDISFHFVPTVVASSSPIYTACTSTAANTINTIVGGIDSNINNPIETGVLLSDVAHNPSLVPHQTASDHNVSQCHRDPYVSSDPHLGPVQQHSLSPSLCPRHTVPHFQSQIAWNSTTKNLLSPSIEYTGKSRWQTPSRVGTWEERWQSARELGTHNCVRTVRALPLSSALRRILSDAVVAYVGPHLPLGTVEKWLCLLCEYLELDADEQILVICLLRRYARSGGRFVGYNDWARPQRWECVVAVACYLAVLLTEEFPGRTALDLKELLGVNFKFGIEQLAFLKSIGWRICVSADEINEVKVLCERIHDLGASAADEMRRWFGSATRDVADAKRWLNVFSVTKPMENFMDQRSPNINVPKSRIQPNADKAQLLNDKGDFATVNKNLNANVIPTDMYKKRCLSVATPAEDSIVPPFVVRRVDPTAGSIVSGNIFRQHLQAISNFGSMPTSSACQSAMSLNAVGGASEATMVNVGTIPTPTGAIPTIPYWLPRW